MSKPAQSTEPRAVRAPEAKVAQKFLEGINTLDFTPSYVAIIFATASPALQTRLMFIFRAWIDALEAEYDRGSYSSDEEYELAITAKRINDGMRPFEE